ncbi:MAG: porphobilinogen synthase [Pseudomonadota bacterium]|nr:porphobilinogen synthase [Pseudomonadota bacterium]
MSFPVKGYPVIRKRRNRRTEFIRNLTSELNLNTNDLILPIFLTKGKNKKQKIPSMDNVFRYSIDSAIKTLSQALEIGIHTTILFPYVESNQKQLDAAEAHNPDGLIQKAITKIKSELPELGIITDIALDPFTTHGHDGILNEDGEIDNEITIDILKKQAITHANAGADILAPSDMMDGRIGILRGFLDANRFENINLLSYSAKFASSFYGPFRDAVGSSSSLGQADKKTYQMNPANHDESLHEAWHDINEGADMIMVKPGMPYLDVLASLKKEFKVPTFVYQVSGEYAMLLSLSNKDPEALKNIVLESMVCFKRGGADAIVTYYAEEIAKWLNS